MNTIKSLRILAGAGALSLVTALSAHAATSSDVATRSGGNVPESAIPHKDGGSTKPGTMDKAKYDSKNQSDKSERGSAFSTVDTREVKPAGGSATGGSPDNSGTKAVEPRN